MKKIVLLLLFFNILLANTYDYLDKYYSKKEIQLIKSKIGKTLNQDDLKHFLAKTMGKNFNYIDFFNLKEKHFFKYEHQLSFEDGEKEGNIL